MSEKQSIDISREGLVVDQDSMYEIDLENKIVFWSNGAENMYGWMKNEAVGKNVYDLFKTDFHLKMYDSIIKTMKKYIWTGELTQHKRDGSKKTVSSHAILHRDEAGDPRGIIFVNTDITAAKKVEEALRVSEERLAVTLNSIGDGVLATDINGKVTFLNPVARQLTGWSQAKAEGRQVEEVFKLINYNTRQPFVFQMKEPLRHDVALDSPAHIILISAEGMERQISINRSAIHDRTGEATGVVLVFRDITERIERELILEQNRINLAAEKIISDESRSYSEGIINTVRESLIVLNSGLRVVSASRYFYEFFRLKPSEVLGKHIYDLGNREWDIPKLRELLDTILPYKNSFNDYVVNHEFKLLGKRVMLLNARQIGGAAGRNSLILLAIEDITERRAAGDNMRMFNRTLRAISSVNQVLMHSKNENDFLGRVCEIIMKTNVYKLAWVGFAENDDLKTIRPVARAGFEIKYLNRLNLTWDDSQKGKSPAGKAVRTGKTVVCGDVTACAEFKPWLKETVKRGYMSLIALPLRSGRDVFGVLSIYSAALEPFSEPEIKLLEELAFDISYGIMLIRIKEGKKSAETNINKIATFPRLNPNPISEIDISGKMYYVNPAFSRIFTKAAEFGMKHAWFSGVHAIFRKFKGKRKKIMKRELQVEDKYFLQTLVYMPSEKTIRIYGIDITERRKAENELRRLYEEMEIKVQQRASEQVATQHLADIGLLAATVAHELRNPLGVIGVAAYNLRKKAATTRKDMMGHIENIEKKVAESGQIINNLLVYSRMKMPQFEKTEIYQLLTDCAVSITKNFKNRKVRLVKKLTGLRGVQVDADPLQLTEVFNNLITNAYHAMGKRKGTVTVKASLKNGNIISIQVKDTGTGILKEDMGNLFKPFFTRKSKGTGLGLVICREIINMHNGSIEVKSRQGRGSTFTVNMPLRRL